MRDRARLAYECPRVSGRGMDLLWSHGTEYYIPGSHGMLAKVFMREIAITAITPTQYREGTQSHPSTENWIKDLLFSGKWTEPTPKNGALFTSPRKPHKIMQIKRFKSSCSL